MSPEKKIRRLQKRDGDLCIVCKRDLSEELRKFYETRKAMRTLPPLRKELGLKIHKRRSINLNVDHKIPVSRGGTNDVSNLGLSHVTCNQRKGSRLLEELI